MIIPKLITVCNFPPVPDRRFDWCAYYEGDEESGRYGYGATEAEAVADFVENYVDEEEEARQRERVADANHCGGLSPLGEELVMSMDADTLAVKLGVDVEGDRT